MFALPTGHLDCRLVTDNLARSYPTRISSLIEGGYYVIGQVACRHGEEADAANVPKKRWPEVFGGWVVKDGVSLVVGRRTVGLHQVATTSSSPSTTTERMRLLATQLQEDPQ